MTAGLDPEMLRALVREALADLLPAETGAAGPAPAEPAPASAPAAQTAPVSLPSVQLTPASSAPAQGGAAYTVRDGVAEVETVSVRTDRELAAFVTRLLHLVENPRRRDDLRAGRLRFRLAPGGAAGAGGSARPTRRIDKGAVTEAAVRDAARAGARLVLGRRAVLTPLARDRARSAGVEIEKER
ncbi:MAG: hypothetical protein ACRDMI_10070 [Streptosporangiaceae bacterium]